MAIHLSCCTGADSFAALQTAGVKYVELALNYIGVISDDEFQQVKSDLQKYGLTCVSTYAFFPWEYKLVGEERDLKACAEFLKKACTRLGEIGVKVAVLGCGGGRRVPEGGDYATNEKEFGETIALAAYLLSKKADGCKLAIEPINSRETNFLTTVRDAADYVRKLRDGKVDIDFSVVENEIPEAGSGITADVFSNVGVIADFYHMRMDEEPMDDVLYAGDLIYDTHIARNGDRAYPQKADEDLYREFVDDLRKIDYDGVVSIEGNTGDFERDIKVAAKVFETII